MRTGCRNSVDALLPSVYAAKTECLKAQESAQKIGSCGVGVGK